MAPTLGDGYVYLTYSGEKDNSLLLLQLAVHSTLVIAVVVVKLISLHCNDHLTAGVLLF